MQSQYSVTHEQTSDQSSLAALTTGRTIGILLLLQLIAALTLPFILAKPITVGSPGFLSVGADHAAQIRCAVLLSLLGAALTVYLGIKAFQEFRLHSKSAAQLFLIVCAISCTLDLLHAGTIMSLLYVSTAYVNSGATEPGMYEVVGLAAAAARRSTHSMQLLAIGAWMLVFYISLLRFRLVPRWLSITGIVGVALQFTGVTLMMFLGYPLVGVMAMPLLPIQITVGLWLIVKGFIRTRQ